MGNTAKVDEVQVGPREIVVVENFTVAGKTALGHPERPSLAP